MNETASPKTSDCRNGINGPLGTKVTIRASSISRPFIVRESLNDRYADAIIGDCPHEYDGIEIQGVRNHFPEGDPRGTCIAVDANDPQFYSVYVRDISGGSECVGDMGTYALAQAYANELSGNYGWPISDFTTNLKKAKKDDIDVRIMIGAQAAYACITTSTTTLDVRLSSGMSEKKSLSESAIEMRTAAKRLLARAELIEAAANQF